MTLPSDCITRLADGLKSIGCNNVEPDGTGGVEGRWATPPTTVYMSVRSFEPAIVGSTNSSLIQFGVDAWRDDAGEGSPVELQPRFPGEFDTGLTEAIAKIKQLLGA